LRATGPSSLAASLDAAADFLKPVIQCDGGVPCRKYAVILLTDGAETCQGNPVLAAGTLLTAGVQTYVVGFSVLGEEQASLNQIAVAGGTTAAYFAANEQQLAAALANIVSKSVMYEKCNGLDDNCNGQCDETWPEVAVTGAACTNPHAAQTCSAGVGACKRDGVYVCNAQQTGSGCSVVAGAPTCPGAPGCNPQGEICYNGVDDDCDGTVDEGCLPCVSQPEICDGKDNNCNGLIDEGYVSVPCGSNIGECKAGTTACVAGKVVCNGAVGPTAEICDGKDNNCDTITDNFTEPCYPPGGGAGCDLATGVCKGVCKMGIRLCTSGVWGACQGYQGPKPEVCNGLDDDCDGVIDNGVGNVCMDYATCATGISCTACASKPEEICDGKDNDCDGNTDDVFPEKGKVCGSSVGECKPGTWVCVKGKLDCQGSIGPTTEVCDGKDNDCNGIIDDKVPGEGEVCWPGGYTPPACPPSPAPCPCPPGAATCGECKAGKTKCVAGKYACDGGVGPTTEICDGKDNDCDGQIDDSAECPNGAVCLEGKCLVSCAGVEFSCPGGTKCVNGYCVPDKCAAAKCKPTERCIDGDCVEKCTNVTCGEHEKCEPTTGQCVDDTCVSKGCPTGQACINLACVEDPCPPGKCPAGQVCSAGQCFETCLNITCPSGQVCSRGKCITNPCEGYPCGSNYVCELVDGKPTCDPDPCRVIFCGKGRACFDGTCIPDPCETTRCPTGFLCHLNTVGEADCEAIPGQVPTTDQFLATGGGGCACTVADDPGGGAGLALLLLGLVVVVRRRSRDRKSVV
jgi:MYXO-CTERM domain-containing protein